MPTCASTKSQVSLAEQDPARAVAALLEVVQVYGVVDVAVRVHVAPADLDADLVVHDAGSSETGFIDPERNPSRSSVT